VTLTLAFTLAITLAFTLTLTLLVIGTFAIAFTLAFTLAGSGETLRFILDFLPPCSDLAWLYFLQSAQN